MKAKGCQVVLYKEADRTILHSHIENGLFLILHVLREH